MEDNKMEKQLDLLALVTVLKKFWIFILLLSVLAAVVAGVLTETMVTPTYTCRSSYLVNPNKSSSLQSSSSLIYVAEKYASEFADNVVTTRTTIYNAIRTNGEKNGLVYSEGGEALVNSVGRSVSAGVSTTSSQTFIVTVTSTSATRAYDIALTLEGFLPDYLARVADSSVEVSLIDGAMPPSAPNSNHMTRNVVLAALVTAIVAYLAFLLYQMLNNELTDEDMLLQAFQNMPILGRIPTWGDPGRKMFRQEKKNNFSNHSRNYDNKFLTPDTPYAIAESFKTLRSNVSYSVHAEGTPVLGVTSIRKASGKTIVLANLAASYAMLGKRVLLIEADMRVPAFHKVLGLKKGAGLSEVLAGIAPDHKKCILSTKMAGLDVLLSGQIPPNPSELLSSNRMRALIEAVKAEYDIVLLDLPPFAGITDASVVSNIVDGYLLVTRMGYTNLRELKYGLNDMKQVGMHVLGFVVNDISMKSSHYAYYRYGYKHSYAYQYGSSTAEAAAPIAVEPPVVPTPPAVPETPVATEAPVEETPTPPRRTRKKKAVPQEVAPQEGVTPDEN